MLPVERRFDLFYNNSTGGIMAIGVAAGIYGKNRSGFTEYVREQRMQYWQWWQSRWNT